VTTNSILIIGADSIIGNAFYNIVKKNGFEVNSTSRRNTRDHVMLDLTWELDKWPKFPKVDSLLVFSSINNIYECDNNELHSYAVNVEGLEKAIINYTHSDTQIIILSSSKVFSGKKPFVRKNEKPDPQCVYGKHKLIAEQKVLGYNGLVLRVTKIVDPLFPRFIDWISNLKKGKAIEAYDNLFASLVPLDSIIQTLLIAVNENWRNIEQISGKEDMSYYNIARLIANKINCDQKLVRPIKGDLEHLGINYPFMTIKTSKSVRKKNIFVPKTKILIKEWVNNYYSTKNVESKL